MRGRRPVSSGPWDGWARPVRLVTLTAMALFLAWAATRLAEPRRWLWWETELSARPATGSAAKAGGRRAPSPDATLLSGCLDREPFWSETADNPLRGPLFVPRRQDADARYHLLLLAHAVPAHVLLADAEPCPPVTELLQAPERYRGALLRVQGHCFGLRRMKLTRGDLPGVASCFQAFLTVGTTQERLLVLFTELPEKAGLPAESEWPRLWRRDVAAAGFFLKIVRIDSPKAGDEPAFLPVLVGRTVFMPPDAEPAPPNAPSGLWVFGLMAGPVVLVLLWLAWLWRREDGPWHRRRARLEQRRQVEQTQGVAASSEEQSKQPS